MAWEQIWDGAELVVTDPGAARELITSVAVEAVYDHLVGVYNPTVDGETPSTPRVFVNNPVVEEQPDGSVVIDDCLFESPRAQNRTVWYRGTASPDGEGWVIDGLEVVNPIGCVPDGMGAGVIEGYEAYWDARLEFWEPADPDHPLVEETLTGPQFALVRDLLAEHQASGFVVRGRQVGHPEIIQVRSASEVVVLDCHELDPEQGVFDAATGERQPGIPVAGAGDRGLLSAVMVLQEGRWKVSDVQGRDRVDCDFAPTPQGLPVVGS